MIDLRWFLTEPPTSVGGVPLWEKRCFMYLVTSAEMKEIDRTTTEKYGVPPEILMENAGINAVTCLRREYGSLIYRRVHIFCGTGNNGGDGFVIARHLKSEGAAPKVFITGQMEKLSPESKAHLEMAKKYGVEAITLSSSADLEKHANDITQCDIVVDSLIGTGLNKQVEGFMATLITYLNTLHKYTLSVDVPSGVDADTGDIKGVAIYADLTVTFGLPKVGVSIYPGLECVGKLVVADINFPVELLSKPRPNVLITGEIAAPLMPYRHPNANKGHFGPIFMLAGSPGLDGAATLTARAALKSGAGIVNIGIPEGLYNSVKSRSEESIVTALKETKTGCISMDNYSQIMEICEKAKVVVIGPGLGRDKETQELVRKLVENVQKPMVVDADGLNAVSEDKKCLKNIKKDVIFTPHIGEMARLSGLKIEDIIKDKIKAAREFVAANPVNVLLKDGRSVVVDTAGNAYVNTTGNSGMATPGSGDVLTGMVATLMAHGLFAAQAGITANYLHGLAADMILAQTGAGVMTAGDLIGAIPGAMTSLKKQEA